MDASIGVSRDTKAQLGHEKPVSLTWDAFLKILRRSVDERILRQNLQRVLDEVERESVDLAIQRVHALRTRKEPGFRLVEARERLKRHRLAAELDEVRELLRAEVPPPAVEKAVKSLDRRLHEMISGE